MSNYHRLSDRIAAKKDSMVYNLLNRDGSLDLTYQDGRFFRISIKNNSYKIVEFLLEYFEQNQLGDYEEDSSQYLSLKGQLQYIITDIAEDSDGLSPELEKLLKPYFLNQISADDNSNENLDGFSDPMDNLDPLKHFSNTSSTQNIPEKDVACSGDFSDTTDPIG